ncbi:S8 family peptidase [Longimicrobium sp.]|uniref:S8 family peptidase n=1 Tax=Longimicrobium sp. TaxID=2029185 RepID=UPI002C7CED86|nr:S8 family serine peptidase [Longimicrobium sp.]HSU17779.1 S8 family serine peptidase [Longimicrobium sp.]
MYRIRNTAVGVLAVAALAACSDTPATPSNQTLIPQNANASASVDPVVPGQVLVKFKDGTNTVAAARMLGTPIQQEGYKHAFQIVSVENGQERAAAARLAADPQVEWAEPNYIRHVDAIDSRLWAFFNPGGLNMSFYNDPNGNTGSIPASYASKLDADMDAIEGIAAGGSPVVISSIDTGVDFNHPEFTGRLIAGCDWYSQAAAGNGSATCSDFTPFDTPDEGHGTHTTGTMAGTTVGVAGITGAGPNVKVYVQRVCGPVGCYSSSIINAIRAAADQPNMVAMNLSLGGTTESQGEKSAISYATSKNVLVIVAAGNSGTSKVGCPACDANAISVSATTWQDALAAYSQYGSGLDISAPGGYCYSNTTEDGCIFSAIVAGYQGGRTYSGPLAGGSYAYMQGTSMSTPQVTGAAAAVASKTGLRGSALRTRLQSTADDLGTAGVDTKFGNGRLNVYRAVTNTTLGAGL